MEQANNLSVVPYSAGWSDLGGWDAVWQEQSPDAAGIVTSENVTAIKCTNTLLRSEHGDQHLVGLGSEHWIVVEGTAKVTINEAVKIVTEGQSVYIPLGAVHRMQNPGKMPMVLIEVQTGAYLGEDDIIRYEDQYARS